MHAVTAIFFLASYTAFLVAFIKKGTIYPNFALGFCVFMSIQFGPHTALNLEILRLSPLTQNPSVHITYNIIISSLYLLLALALSITRKEKIFPEIREISKTAKLPRRLIITAVVISILLCLISIVLQRGTAITTEHIKFLLGASFFSYTEIRRVMFEGTAWHGYANLIRFTIVPILYGILLINLLSLKGFMRKLANITLMIALLALCAIQLNKFFFLYYLTLTFFIVYTIKTDEIYKIKALSLVKRLPLFLLIGSVFLYAVYRLYLFQYSNTLETGQLRESDILRTLFFRVFFASSDSLRLWIDYFYYQQNSTGLAGVGKICALFSSGCVNINTLIPAYYLGDGLTSLQAGFIGTALSVGGVILVPLFIIIAIMIVLINCRAQALFKNSTLIPLVSFHFFLNSFFFTTRELQTSILSGGALSLALIYTLVYVSFIKPQNLNQPGFKGYINANIKL